MRKDNYALDFNGTENLCFTVVRFSNMYYIIIVYNFYVHYMRHYMKSIANHTLPRAARRSLAKLGEDIAVARRKRRISTVSMAERAFISRSTLYKVERGDPTVSMGIYATVLAILGLSERLGNVVDRRDDILGLDIEEDRLPKRIVSSRRRKRT